MVVLFILAASLALAAPSPPNPSPTVVGTATTTAAKTTAGKSTPFGMVSDKTYQNLVVAPHKGKVLLVNFWASYCLPCLEEIPALQALQSKHDGSVDVVFVATDPPDSGEHVLRVLGRRHLKLTSFIVENEDPDPFIHLIDDVWQGEMPYTVVYDRDGRVHKKLPGAQTAATFEAAVLAARAVPATGSTP
jgi:thiol-disulfide isomerase/thioredoxin